MKKMNNRGRKFDWEARQISGFQFIMLGGPWNRGNTVYHGFIGCTCYESSLASCRNLFYFFAFCVWWITWNLFVNSSNFKVGTWCTWLYSTWQACNYFRQDFCEFFMFFMSRFGRCHICTIALLRNTSSQAHYIVSSYLFSHKPWFSNCPLPITSSFFSLSDTITM